ncbi:carboxy-terminal domain RNA polymerase II polypeptide A small phosphatase 1 isoform X1 [Amborella trichopoda]|uniref:carboxy-terminal domain RNA polymerase II polypeptide A small phosphatase 1 isoform X1 n=1 Tax=Amborella trichopoda TaxID=13333 RepID=UPI0005D350DF|nr:carboxy-terminal domain RNA polymerase II polypeptide A small phosphatase 1 isoform X1 [Amborella trichopoda]|eukprot:XP_011623015.1 carboxy-terminal domain RNA polymerase II polypeptide A small phosphatase 1 isoform X1 [Amborella trichopoda]
MALVAQGEVVSPRSLQIWRGFLNWLAFFFQILLQLLQGTPTLAQIFGFFGLRPALLCDSPPPFKPLPVEPTLPEEEFPACAEEETFDKLTMSMQVVLDLDETLVCAYETSSLPIVVRNQATQAGLNWFELECVSTDTEGDGKQKVNHVTVFERPGLHEFLAKLSEFAELILFTAGLEAYARPLVDRIDLENRFSHRLYRPSTTSTKYREHVKDLSCLSKDLCRIVIVDNNPFSFLLQPLNGIPCLPFSAGQPNDEQLIEVLLPLLKHLSLQKDVRPALHERFHMPEWFQKHGIPSTYWLP